MAQGCTGGRSQLRLLSKHVLSRVKGEAETYYWIFFWSETSLCPLDMDSNNLTKSALMDTFWAVWLSWVWK